MRIFVNGIIYDSKMEPVLIEFDPEEVQALELDCDRIVAAPPYLPDREKLALAYKDISRLGYLEMFLDRPKK